MAEPTGLVELANLILSRGMLLWIGWVAGVLSAITAYILLRVLPKMNTFLSMLDFYHKHRKEIKKEEEGKNQKKGDEEVVGENGN